MLSNWNSAGSTLAMSDHGESWVLVKFVESYHPQLNNIIRPLHVMHSCYLFFLVLEESVQTEAFSLAIDDIPWYPLVFHAFF